MAGFVVDPAGLQTAITKLKGLRDQAGALLQSANRLEPGELTANDTYTKEARLKLQERATGDKGSLKMITEQLQAKLQEKIDSYEAVLADYRATDENAAADHRKLVQ